MTPDTIIVIQARLGSTRLPGKVLAPMDRVPLLVHCIRRLLSAGAGPVVVATSDLARDAPVAGTAAQAGARVVRGDEADVLGRFARAIEDWSGPFVIRATGDNPAVDPGSVTRVRAALAGGADYAVERGLPLGATVEGVRADRLRRAAAEAVSPRDREHVTPFIRARPDRFLVVELDAPPELARPDLRFTVDTPDDFAYMRALLEDLGAGSRIVPLAEIIARATRPRPDA